ncbi:MAG: hypothetical protein KKH75_03615 [Actinobacteria bacterium]|nr:hypothetical protein [Actinomycetota bacterium]
MTAGSERVRFRIESFVADADYRSADEAVADAMNIALLSADPAAAKAREVARAAAVREANADRGASTGTTRQAGLRHRVMSIAAMVLGAIAVGVIALSPRSGSAAFTLQQGAFVAGLIAVASVAIMIWLEPLRRSGELWGSNLPARVYFFFAVLWIGFAGSVVAFRWNEVDRYQPWPVIIGLVLFVLAGIAALVLWWQGRRLDRSGARSGRARALRGLVDDADAPAVFDALDRWWAVEGPRARSSDEKQLFATHREVLAYLARTGLIDPSQERKAAQRKSVVEWKERRP